MPHGLDEPQDGPVEGVHGGDAAALRVDEEALEVAGSAVGGAGEQGFEHRRGGEGVVLLLVDVGEEEEAQEDGDGDPEGRGRPPSGLAGDHGVCGGTRGSRGIVLVLESGGVDHEGYWGVWNAWRR